MSFEQQLISWRRELHQNPELSLQEVATTARIRDWLQSGGLTLPPYDLKTRVAAVDRRGDNGRAPRAALHGLPPAGATGRPHPPPHRRGGGPERRATGARSPKYPPVPPGPPATARPESPARPHAP